MKKIIVIMIITLIFFIISKIQYSNIYSNKVDNFDNLKNKEFYYLSNAVLAVKDVDMINFDQAVKIPYYFRKIISFFLPNSFKGFIDYEYLFYQTGLLATEKNNFGIIFTAKKDNRFEGQTCFACHSSMIDRLWVPGLINPYISHTKDFLMAQSAAKFLDLKIESYTVDFFENISPIGKNFGTVNFIPYVEYFQGSDQQKKEMSRQIKNLFIYIDANPWWLNKYKESYFRAGWITENNTYKLANGFHLSQKETNPLTIVDNMNNSIEYTKKIEKYIKKLNSPKYHKNLNNNLVEQGRQLFHGEKASLKGERLNCFKCHGIYLKNNKNKGYDVIFKEKIYLVGTDEAYLDHYQKIFSTFLQYEKKLYPNKKTTFIDDWNHLSQKKYGESFFIYETTGKYLGYPAVPLDGIWASAPYLHNGSIPTLWHLLTPEERPLYWSKNVIDMNMDHDKVGISWKKITKEELLKLKKKLKKASFSDNDVKYRSIYDTTLYGQSNKGHYFGQNLTKKEKKAIIEFLKSLGGANIQPLN